MCKKRTITLKNNTLTTIWENSGGEVLVDVFKGSLLLIQWAYPKMPGHGGLAGQANFWFDQVILQAEAFKSETE